MLLWAPESGFMIRSAVAPSLEKQRIGFWLPRYSNTFAGMIGKCETHKSGRPRWRRGHDETDVVFLDQPICFQHRWNKPSDLLIGDYKQANKESRYLIGEPVFFDGASSQPASRCGLAAENAGVLPQPWWTFFFFHVSRTFRAI